MPTNGANAQVIGIRAASAKLKFQAEEAIMNKELFDYLVNGKTLDEFLDNFPDISKDQAIAVLSQILERHTDRRSATSQGRYAGLGAELAA